MVTHIDRAHRETLSQAVADSPGSPWPRPRLSHLVLGLVLLLTAGCAPSPEANVVRYLVQEWQAGLAAGLPSAPAPPVGGSVAGTVTHLGRPVAGVTVIVAEPDGTPHSQITGADGAYRIQDLPPGFYVPAAVGPGFEETALTDRLGFPWLAEVTPRQVVTLPPLELRARRPVTLPAELATAVGLTAGEPYTATADYPPGSTALVQPYRFTRDGVLNDTLRVYLPAQSGSVGLPLLLAVYPGAVDGWQPVSVALAAQGFALVAVSPAAGWGIDIDQHALDARIALQLARNGDLAARLQTGPAVALGGSFSSAILHRLLRNEAAQFGGWVTVGGISNAFSGAADFYAHRLQIPPSYALAIPALGLPNLYPESFLRFSPVYSAGELPPTLLVHTAADTIIPISQAYELEEMLRTQGVPVTVFYYEDTSHYLQIGPDMSEAGRQMFRLVTEFAAGHVESRP